MKDFTLVNCDTDSIMICRPDGSFITEADRSSLLKELNDSLPEKIRFTDDGYFPSVLVLKAKNYVLFDGKKKKIKGSALRGSAREKALQEFIEKFSDLLLNDDFNSLVPLYNKYALEILTLTDIKRWTTKKSLTEKVFEAARTTEANILAAIQGTEYVRGDKIYCYFDTNKKPKLQERWNKDHDIDSLLKKLFSTVTIFDSVIDITQFPNYSLKRSKVLLDLLK